MVCTILSFTTEEIYSLLKIKTNESVHLEKFEKFYYMENEILENKWHELIKV